MQTIGRFERLQRFIVAPLLLKDECQAGMGPDMFGTLADRFAVSRLSAFVIERSAARFAVVAQHLGVPRLEVERLSELLGRRVGHFHGNVQSSQICPSRGVIGLGGDGSLQRDQRLVVAPLHEINGSEIVQDVVSHRVEEKRFAKQAGRLLQRTLPHQCHRQKVLGVGILRISSKVGFELIDALAFEPAIPPCTVFGGTSDDRRDHDGSDQRWNQPTPAADSHRATCPWEPAWRRAPRELSAWCPWAPASPSPHEARPRGFP